MKFLKDINLDFSFDVDAKRVQETSDTLELTLAVMLNQIYNGIVSESLSFSTQNANWWNDMENLHISTATERQSLLDSFDVYAGLAFEQYNIYRNTLLNINPNVSTGGLDFPKSFIFTPFVSNQSSTKNSARTTPEYRRLLYGPKEVKTTNQINQIEITTIYSIYETYIKRTNGSIVYYRWKEVNTNGVITYVDYSYT